MGDHQPAGAADAEFRSVTYGAGGSTRARTLSTIARLLKETRVTPAAHLTCVGAPRGEIDDVVRATRERGPRIVALRGDPPGPARPIVPTRTATGTRPS